MAPHPGELPNSSGPQVSAVGSGMLRLRSPVEDDDIQFVLGADGKIHNGVWKMFDVYIPCGDEGDVHQEFIDGRRKVRYKEAMLLKDRLCKECFPQL